MTPEDRIAEWRAKEQSEADSKWAGPPPDWDLRTPGQNQSGQSPNIHSVCLTDVKVEKPDWLWENRIARGSIIIVEGIEGVGKSTMLCALAGAVSRGRGLPDMYFNGPENVLWLTAEESLSITVKPRLMAAGADLDRVFAIDQPFTFDDAGIGVLMREVDERRPSMVIIDPIFAYTKGDPSKPFDARTLTGQLRKIAEAYNCVIVLVRHIGKSKGLGDPRAAGLYSIEWRAAARSVLLAGCDPDDERKCAVTQTKNNIGPKAEPIGYVIESDSTSPSGARFSWTGLSDLTASRILAPRHQEDSEENARSVDAQDFLRELLRDGRVEAKDVEIARRSTGISDRALGAAKISLKIKPYKEGGEFGGRGAKWYWELANWEIPTPPQELQAPQAPQELHTIENVILVVSDADKDSCGNGLPQELHFETCVNLVEEKPPACPPCGNPDNEDITPKDWKSPF